MITLTFKRVSELLLLSCWLLRFPPLEHPPDQLLPSRVTFSFLVIHSFLALFHFELDFVCNGCVHLETVSPSKNRNVTNMSGNMRALLGAWPLCPLYLSITVGV